MRIYYGLIFGFVFILVMWTCIRGLVGSMCGNQIVSEQISPDRKFKCVVFVRDCGATTGFSTQVSIIRRNEKLRDDDTGNVLTIDDHYYGGKINKFGGADVKVEWVTSKRVLLRFDGEAEVGTNENKIKGIEIMYDEIR